MSTIRTAGLAAKLAAVLLCFAPSAAHAAISCTLAFVSSITMGYNGTFTVDSLTSGGYRIDCTRASGDPSTFSFQLTTDNGQNAGGGGNRASSGGNRLVYDTYRSTTINNGNKWGPAKNFSGTVTFGSATSASAFGTFYVDIASGLNPAAGTYTDSLTATLLDSTGTVTLSTLIWGVTITVTAACSITVPPGNLNFTYTSRQAAAAAASTTFALRCTNGHTYTLSLDATSATLLGLNYTLSVPSGTQTGTGNSQTFTISGSIAGLQSGTCSTATCSGTQTRTVTVTY